MHRKQSTAENLQVWLSAVCMMLTGKKPFLVAADAQIGHVCLRRRNFTYLERGRSSLVPLYTFFMPAPRPLPSSRAVALFGALCPKATDRDALTDAGLLFGSSRPLRSGPPWPPLPTAFAGKPMPRNFPTHSSFTGLGMRGKMVSK